MSEFTEGRAYQRQADAERITQLEAETAALRAAVEQVEWVPNATDGGSHCPWCGANDYEGHYPNCQRQSALAKPEVKA